MKIQLRSLKAKVGINRFTSLLSLICQYCPHRAFLSEFSEISENSGWSKVTLKISLKIVKRKTIVKSCNKIKVKNLNYCT